MKNLKLIVFVVIAACGRTSISDLDANGIPVNVEQDGVRGRWRLISDDSNLLGSGIVSAGTQNPYQNNTNVYQAYPNGYQPYPYSGQNQTQSTANNTIARFYIESSRVTFELNCPNYSNINGNPNLNGFNANTNTSAPLIRSVVNVNSSIDDNQLRILETRSAPATSQDQYTNCVSHLDSNQFDYVLESDTTLSLRDSRTGATLRFTRE